MEKILLNPKKSLEKINVVTTRGGKTTHDLPNPNQSIGNAKGHQEAKLSTTQKEKEQEEETAPKDFIDTNYQSFPTRNCKHAMDEQFAHFVEMTQKIQVSVPRMDILHVPSYVLTLLTPHPLSCHP
jgi:hypothetical protein